MTNERIAPPQSWKRLYHAATLEIDATKSSSLLDDAINAILDQIERTVAQGDLDELNDALGRLRSRRHLNRQRLEGPDTPQAA